MSSADATFWLSLIAIASVVQATLLVVAAIVLFRTANTIRRKADDIQARQIAPFMERARQLLDDVDDAARRVRTLDNDVRSAMTRAGERVDRVTSMVRRKIAPVAGVVRGARVALGVIAGSRPSAERMRTARDEDDEARFTNEGGAHHARK